MINALERITYLKEQKNWSEYQLAEQSGLTQSTISSRYRKNIMPSIPSLENVCAALGITLSQFFAEDSESFSLTTFQKKLLKESGKLTLTQLNALIDFSL